MCFEINAKKIENEVYKTLIQKWWNHKQSNTLTL